ncbi:MAG: ATP-binding cassette domain-containing protein [Phycisphaerales bacterium]|jgi:ABC-2 type transport system ATP-binding protein|nr:ATP-binding cassette domain-containing protein [Phycisphaerales bacterium]MDP6889955.1 ATP-binding cassette domain-containing protein [Phycisphaerales bacterium]
MSDPAATISIQSVTKCFGEITAVRDLDLTVPQGSLIGFLGPNGAGKSTTIRMIMSIIYADEGCIEVLGRSALDAKDRIGYLPEERGLYRRMRVRAFLRYIGRLKGMSRGAADASAARWLERLELPEALPRRCEELSKGQQQKIQFVAAVLHEPDLIVLDEPFSGLDPVNAALLSRVIRELHDEGRTIVFSTHVLHQAEQLCDRIFLIDRGVKLLDDDIDDIRTRFRERIINVELAAGATLPPIPGTRVNEPKENGDPLELHVDDGVDEQSVIRSVVEAAPVRSVSLREPSLDDIFTHLVTGGHVP